jgi:hypothetical protein
MAPFVFNEGAYDDHSRPHSGTACRADPYVEQAERQQIAAELAMAELKLAEEEAAFEALISADPPE